MKLLESGEKKFLSHALAWSIGLTIGGLISFGALMQDKPEFIIRDRWRVVQLKPSPRPYLPHTSLTPEEIETILRLQNDPGIAGVTTTTTRPPCPALPVETTTTTIAQ